jgi:hypothetical protein
MRTLPRWLVQVGVPLPASEKGQDKISPGLGRTVFKLALESREGIAQIEFCRHPPMQAGGRPYGFTRRAWCRHSGLHGARDARPTDPCRSATVRPYAGEGT